MVQIEGKNDFVAIFERFSSHALLPYGWRPNFWENESSHGDTQSWYVSLGKYLRLSSYISSKLFVAPKSRIFGCFWVVFRRLQPQIKSDLYKNFTSDTVQSNVSHMLQFLI